MIWHVVDVCGVQNEEIFLSPRWPSPLQNLFCISLKGGGAASPKIDFCSLGKKSFEIDFHVRHENNILQNVYN